MFKIIKNIQNKFLLKNQRNEYYYIITFVFVVRSNYKNLEIVNVNTDFFKILVKNIDGKRAFLQRKGRQILISLKKRIGEVKLLEMIKQNGDLNEQESTLLLRQLKKDSQKGSKKQSNFRDFLKMQKVQSA